MRLGFWIKIYIENILDLINNRSSTVAKPRLHPKRVLFFCPFAENRRV